MASRLTLDSKGDVQIDLTALPDAPGSCWLIERGKALTGAPVRCVDAHESAAKAAAEAVVVRDLHESEEVAIWRVMDAAKTPAAAGEAADRTAAEGTDEILYGILRREGPKTLGQIHPADGADGEPHPAWCWSRRTASNGLMRLSGAGRAVKEGATWFALDEEGQPIREGRGDEPVILDAQDVERLIDDLMKDATDGSSREDMRAFLIQSKAIEPINLEPSDGGQQ